MIIIIICLIWTKQTSNVFFADEKFCLRLRKILHHSFAYEFFFSLFLHHFHSAKAKTFKLPSLSFIMIMIYIWINDRNENEWIKMIIIEQKKLMMKREKNENSLQWSSHFLPFRSISLNVQTEKHAIFIYNQF